MAYFGIDANIARNHSKNYKASRERKDWLQCEADKIGAKIEEAIAQGSFEVHLYTSMMPPELQIELKEKGFAIFNNGTSIEWS